MRNDILKGRIVAAWLLCLAVVTWMPRSATSAGARPSVLAPTLLLTQGRDTIRDSLLATEAEYQGWKWFHVYCYRCHGTDAFGGQLAPDLRLSLSSQGSVTKDGFMVTLREGRVTKGMPAWNVLLTEKQFEDLYAYIKARSDGRLAPGRPHKVEQ